MHPATKQRLKIVLDEILYEHGPAALAKVQQALRSGAELVEEGILTPMEAGVWHLGVWAIHLEWPFELAACCWLPQNGTEWILRGRLLVNWSTAPFDQRDKRFVFEHRFPAQKGLADVDRLEAEIAKLLRKKCTDLGLMPVWMDYVKLHTADDGEHDFRLSQASWVYRLKPVETGPVNLVLPFGPQDVDEVNRNYGEAPERALPTAGA